MDLGKLLEESGAILRGHFVLTSGRHSGVYFEKFRVLEQPRVLSALCREIAIAFEKGIEGNRMESKGIEGDSEPSDRSETSELTDSQRRNASTPQYRNAGPRTPDSKPQTPSFVAGPTTGGIIIAFEVARQMGAQAVYVESEEGRKKLRRGKTLPEGAKVLVVDDVLTTGLSLQETIQALREAGAEVVGVGVLIDRSEAPLDFGCPFFAAYRVEARSYAPEEVPEELAAIPIQKPGTRTPIAW